jgi:hypothetical protein
MTDIRQKSMEHLQKLYSTTVGISLSLALYRLLESWAKNSEVKYTCSLLFGAFLVTLIPFYHGALVHLDRAYASTDDSPSKKKDIAHLFAFLMLFIESCLLVALAFLVSLKKPTFFAWSITILFTVDVIWALVTHALGCTVDKEKRFELKWALINFSTLCILVPILYSGRYYRIDNIPLAIGLLAGSIVRTFYDYALCWRCYYPSI